MKLGLIADVRGLLPPLERALSILAARGCDAVACLGSTAEGGEQDEAVLQRLRDVDALVLPSPHDLAPAVKSAPAEAQLAGLELAHATPPELPLTAPLWLTGYEIPDVLQAGERLAAAPEQRACADWFEAMALHAPSPGPARRRIFVRSGIFRVAEGPFVACPGSVAMSERWARGGSLLTWDEASRSLEAVRFGPEGELPPRPIRVLVYCEDFAPHRPDDELSGRAEIVEKADADAIAADLAEHAPDLVLLDYHLAGEKSGLDALLEVRPDGAPPPCPIFTIAGNPADQGSMKDCGALGELPFAFLKDTFTRLLVECGAGD